VLTLAGSRCVSAEAKVSALPASCKGSWVLWLRLRVDWHVSHSRWPGISSRRYVIPLFPFIQIVNYSIHSTGCCEALKVSLPKNSRHVNLRGKTRELLFWQHCCHYQIASGICKNIPARRSSYQIQPIRFRLFRDAKLRSLELVKSRYTYILIRRFHRTVPPHFSLSLHIF
jgi:hypothetical protein